MKNNKIISLVYKTILLTISLIAMYTMIYNININTLAYYTNLSNICVFIFTSIIWVLTLKDVLNGDYESKNTHLVKLKGIATLCIFITGTIYATLLAHYELKENYGINNLSVHYIIPLLFVLDYFLFDKKGIFKWHTPLIWIGASILYLPYIFIRASLATPSMIKYPYFFLDYDKLGPSGLTMWIAILVVVFTTISYGLYLSDHFISKRKAK